MELRRSISVSRSRGTHITILLRNLDKRSDNGYIGVECMFSDTPEQADEASPAKRRKNSELTPGRDSLSEEPNVVHASQRRPSPSHLWRLPLVCTVFLSLVQFSPLMSRAVFSPIENSGSVFSRDTISLGDLAPTFVLRELFTDEPVFLRDYSGQTLRQPWKESVRQVIVLSFWATWCEPCREEIPILTELANRLMSKPVQIFLINTQERPQMSEETLRLLVKQRGYSLPVLLDATGSVASRYGVRSLPTLIVIDKFGIVKRINRGFHPGFERDLERLVRDLVEVSEKP